MQVIGKIKFAHTRNNKKGAEKTDYFRVVDGAKDKSGDWQTKAGFPEQLTKMDFYFPFSKMENNIKIVYSGYAQLPSNGRNSKEESYFITSEGIGHPIMAIPEGHNGVTYDGRSRNLLLTEERLAKWTMVKKRMTMFMTPKNCSPHEYVVWHTTSEIAINNVVNAYMDICSLIGDNLSLIPLTFKSLGQSGKNTRGIGYRFFYGSIGVSMPLLEWKEAIETAKSLREFFKVSTIESAFEQTNFFYKGDEDDIPDGFVKQDAKNGGQIVNEETGEVFDPSKQINYADVLVGFTNKEQAKKIATMAHTLGREEEILKVSSIGSALSLMNSLQNEINKKEAA